MFLTYAEYINYGGTLSETDFARFCFRAEAILQTETFGRIKTADEKVKRCIFDLIDIANQTGAGIASVSNDGYSISYLSKAEAEQKMSDIIYDYFVDDDILYCGADGAGDYVPEEPIVPTGWQILKDTPESDRIIVALNNRPILVKAGD